MILEWYPQQLEPEKEGYVQRFIRKDLKKHNNLRARVEEFLKEVKAVRNLQPFFDTEHIMPVSDGLYEMRIPKQASGGVVRIYFCHHPKDPSKLILLEAELKKKIEPMKKENALKRYREYLRFCLERRSL